MKAKKLIHQSTENQASTEAVKIADQKMTFLAYRYMTSVAILFSMFFVFSTLDLFYSNVVWINFCLYVSVQIAFTNSFTNALIFLFVNKKARRCLIKLLPTWINYIDNSVVNVRALNTESPA